MMMRAPALIFAAMLATATPAFAATDVLTVDFGFFPQGTTCKIFNTTGKVTMRTGREIEFTDLRQALAVGTPWTPELIESLMPGAK